MNEVDVITAAEIDRPRADVAAYASDPDTATEWYSNIKSVQWRSPRPLAVGSQFLMARSMRRANERDLQRLKGILEAHRS